MFTVFQILVYDFFLKLTHELMFIKVLVTAEQCVKSYGIYI